LLRRGIPAYRLPEDVLKNEIARIADMGCRIFCNTPVTQDFLKQATDRYDALFMGCGYGRSLQMNIPGEQMAIDGLAFLEQCRKGKASVCAGGTAAVIGGGNTALDAVRSLVRMGAKPVLIYRRRREDMPAFAEEIEAALKEGVKIRELLAPLRMQASGGDLVLTLQKMKPSGFDAEGRMRVVPDGANTVTLKVQQVFTAIGAEPEEDWYVPRKSESSFPPSTFNTSGKRLDMSHCTLIRQYLPMVFGGDLTNPVKSVTDAIASGKQAAMALDIFSRDGWNMIEAKLDECRVGKGNSLSFEMYLNGNRKKRNPHIVSFKEINSDYFQPADRVMPPLLCLEDCLASFSEPEQTYSEASALAEAGRCFNCGICNDCDNCRLFCPELSVFIENTRQINMDYCKGCGICVAECPRNAMGLE
jgi:NADPH-dependent glutamate synthase beta subunit-like oxidoreductase